MNIFLKAAITVALAVTMGLSVPALASTDEQAQAEIDALKAQVQALTATVGELQKQQGVQAAETDETQKQQAAQATELSQIAPSSGAHNWSGPYAGANVGAGMASGMVEDKDCFECASDSFSEGFVQGGLHSGYNWQMKNTVLGIEGEVNLGSQDHKGLLGGADGDHEFTKSRIDWSAAILGRAGITAGDTLFFVDAGPALAHLNGSGFLDPTGGNTTTGSYTVDTWTPGIKGGIGAEFMVAPNVSIRAQYSILELADKTANLSPDSSCTQFGSTNICRDGWTNMQQAATIGADWHF